MVFERFILIVAFILKFIFFYRFELLGVSGCMYLILSEAQQRITGNNSVNQIFRKY